MPINLPPAPAGSPQEADIDAAWVVPVKVIPPATDLAVVSAGPPEPDGGFLPVGTVLKTLKVKEMSLTDIVSNTTVTPLPAPIKAKPGDTITVEFEKDLASQNYKAVVRVGAYQATVMIPHYDVQAMGPDEVEKAVAEEVSQMFKAAILAAMPDWY